MIHRERDGSHVFPRGAVAGMASSDHAAGISGRDMVKVTFVGPNGSERTVNGDQGFSLMEVAVRNGVAGIVADCGGACACATCHVYVNDGWYEKLSPPSDAEVDMLDMALAVEPNSRLSCQIVCADALDGIKVTVAPE